MTTHLSFCKMLLREIGVSSNLVSYGKGNPARFLETVILCEAFRGNLETGSSLCYHTISVHTCFCVCIYFCLFSILLSLCNTIFSFSFKHNEHLLLLVLYAWCLPKISHVMFVLCLLSFILQNSLDSSVSDLRFL